jgi:hypothetical protein
MGETLRKLTPYCLFVAFLLDLHYKVNVLEFWFMTNFGEEKALKIVIMLRMLKEVRRGHQMKSGDE